MLFADGISAHWAEDGSGICVLKSVEDKEYETKRTSLVTFAELDGKVKKTVYDPAKDASFPKEMHRQNSSRSR